jgi:hypothetical protein
MTNQNPNTDEQHYNMAAAEDLRGTGMSGSVNHMEYKKRLTQVFSIISLEKVISRHGQLTKEEQHQRGLTYYVNAISTWKENGGMLNIAGKSIDWLQGSLLRNRSSIDLCVQEIHHALFVLQIITSFLLTMMTRRLKGCAETERTGKKLLKSSGQRRI